MPCRFASSGTVATSRRASRAILALNVASNFLRDLVISVLHLLRQSRTLHTLTFGPISGVHFRLQWFGPVRDEVSPRRLPAADEDFLIDALDERFLGGKVSVEQGLGDPQPLREFAGLPLEPVFGEKCNSFSRDDGLALGRIESLWLFGSTSRTGFSGWFHD